MQRSEVRHPNTASMDWFREVAYIPIEILIERFLRHTDEERIDLDAQAQQILHHPHHQYFSLPYTCAIRLTIYLVLAGPLVLYLAPCFELPGKIFSGLSLLVTKNIRLFPGSLAPLHPT